MPTARSDARTSSGCNGDGERQSLHHTITRSSSRAGRRGFQRRSRRPSSTSRRQCGWMCRPPIAPGCNGPCRSSPRSPDVVNRRTLRRTTTRTGGPHVSGLGWDAMIEVLESARSDREVYRVSSESAGLVMTAHQITTLFLRIVFSPARTRPPAANERCELLPHIQGV